MLDFIFNHVNSFDFLAGLVAGCLFAFGSYYALFKFLLSYITKEAEKREVALNKTNETIREMQDKAYKEREIILKQSIQDRDALIKEIKEFYKEIDKRNAETAVANMASKLKI